MSNTADLPLNPTGEDITEVLRMINMMKNNHIDHLVKDILEKSKQNPDMPVKIVIFNNTMDPISLKDNTPHQRIMF